jgi:hypothetical protein
LRHYQELESDRLNASFLTLRAVKGRDGTALAKLAADADRKSLSVKGDLRTLSANDVARAVSQEFAGVKAAANFLLF